MWQYWSHFKYTVIHKWYVFVLCGQNGMLWRGITHDLSKFTPVEFSAYANYFFHPDGTRRNLDTEPPLSRQNEAFSRAWCHHAHVNDHHWQYWVITTHGSHYFAPQQVICPTYDAMAEMFCDMVGASAAQGNPHWIDGAREYYLKHKDQIELHEVAKLYLESRLGCMFGKNKRK
jgi:hypothetical protein